MRVLAIDQGTSGTKAVVVDHAGGDRRAAGGVVALAEEQVRPSYAPGGLVEVDPAALLASVVAAGRRAVAAAGGRIDAVALANQGETVLAWDRGTGAPLSPALVWQDRRAESVCAGMAADVAWIAERTGLVLDPYFSAPKMAWLRRHATRDGVVTTTDTWLAHHLTGGAFVTDTSTASRSLLVDVDARAWDDELLAAFDLGAEELPEIVDADTVVGVTEAFGGRPVPVGGLVVDQAAALLAQGCRAAGEAKCTFGTGAFLLAATGPGAVRSSAGLSTSVAWTTREGAAHYLDGQVFTAGSAVRWLCELGLLASAQDLDAVVADDAAGALCVPALAGLAAPWWQPAATASLTGMTLATGRGQVVRAVVEGIAAQVAELLACVEADLGAPVHRLRVDGGLTASRALVQAVADLAGVPVEVYPTPHATALGAAALGRMAVEPGLALADAVPAWAPARTHEPAWPPERAADFRTRWRAAADLAADRPQGAPTSPEEGRR